MKPARQLLYVLLADQDALRAAQIFAQTAQHLVLAVSDFNGLREALAEGGPGCVLIEWRLTPMSSLAAILELAQVFDGCPIILLVSNPSLRFAVDAIKAGATDVIEMPVDEDVLAEALRLAFDELGRRRERASDRAQARHLLSALSHRERQVFDFIVEGFSNKLIARELDLSVRTVEMHRANMMQKLGAKSLQAVMQVGLKLTSTGS